MNAKEFSIWLKTTGKEADDLMKRKMPALVGRMAKDHYQDNFRKGGFVNNGLNPWPKAKRLSCGRTDAASNRGTLLSTDDHLFKSIKYVPSDYRVRVANDLLYAPVHNWGGTVSPTVTPKMRRYAWWKYYQAAGKIQKVDKGKKKNPATTGKIQTENPEALFWKRLALTKKKKLQVRIPQRQFLGESRELSDKIGEKIEKEVNKIVNK